MMVGRGTTRETIGKYSISNIGKYHIDDISGMMVSKGENTEVIQTDGLKLEVSEI